MKKAFRLQLQEAPWFIPAAIWLFASSVGTWTCMAILVLQLCKTRFGLLPSVGLGVLAVLLPLAITGFAYDHIFTSWMRPFYRQARSEIEAELNAAQAL